MCNIGIFTSIMLNIAKHTNVRRNIIRNDIKIRICINDAGMINLLNLLKLRRDLGGCWKCTNIFNC